VMTSLARIGFLIGITIHPYLDCSCGKSMGFGLRFSGYVGYVFERTKHMSGMGPVSLVP
jgi:hypothetical protein